MSPIIGLFVLAAAVSTSQAHVPIKHVKKNFCPPLGTPGSDYQITVLSAESKTLSGCVVPRANWGNGDFDMWFDEGGSCTSEQIMNHFHFNCVSTWKYTETGPSNWTYVMLHDTTAARENPSRRPLRCALYTVLNGGARILMAMAGEKLQPGTGCDDAAIFANLPNGDSDIVASSRPNRPILIQLDRTDTEPDMDLEQVKEVETKRVYLNKLNRKRRSPTDEPDFGGDMANTCRFPEYTQGQWSNLRIDGGAIRYVYVYNADDFDNEGINNDSENQGDEGEDGDAEMRMRRRIRRELNSSDLKKTIETIKSSIPPSLTNFDVQELIKKRNLTHIDHFNIILNSLFKGVKPTMAPYIKSEIPVTSKMSSHVRHSIPPFEDYHESFESISHGYEDVDGELVLNPRSVNRRESDSSDLMQTMETINNSIPSAIRNFNVTEFIEKYNLTDYPLGELDAISLDYFKPIKTTTATNNVIDPPVSSKLTSRKRRSTSPNYTDEEVKKVNKFRKIARIERLWDEYLRNDIQRAFETFDYYGFPEKIHNSVEKAPNNPSTQANPAADDYFKKPILEAWDSFKSLFGFSANEDQPVFPPTPPSTPPNTPPRPPVVKNDQIFGVQIVDLLDDQTNKQNNYVEYSHDSNLEPTKRKKRCYWDDATTTMRPVDLSRPVFGEFDEHNRDKTMDPIDKFNKEHDVLNDDKGQSRNENIPVIIMGSISEKNEKTNSKRETYSPQALEKIFYTISNYLKTNKREPARPKGIAVTRYSLDFQDDEINRQKRSANDDYEEQVAMEYGEMEEEVRRAPIVAEERAERFMSWWTDYRNSKMDMYRRQYGITEQLKEVEYQKYPEMRPMPSAVEFLNTARSLGVPHKLALIQWRSLEREHRMWLANLEFIAFPGQNHPDVSLGDFDHTYEDIELEFDPEHPEGTAEDPTAYLVYTVPGGGPRIGSRMTRRAVWEQKRHSANTKPSATDHDDYTIDDEYDSDYVVPDISENEKMFKASSGSDFAYEPRIKDEKITEELRTKRSTDERPSQTTGPQKFAWRCIQPAQDFGSFETTGSKFLIMGGRIYDEETGPAVTMPKDNGKATGDINYEQVYGCLWLVSRGPNVLEFSVLATGIPRAGQDMKSFAQELCTENQTRGRDSSVRSKNKLRPRRRWWFTETRPEEKNRVQVSCPVPPGTVFYGVVPAPPPPQSSDPNATPSSSSRQMCARLVSAADDCQPGDAGRLDRMKYTVSDCVEQEVSIDGSLPREVIAPPKPQDVFEERAYQCLGQWTEMQQNGPGEASAMLTYTFVKRMDSSNPGAPEYECFVGTTVPNDPGRDPATTTTLMLTEAGTGNRCSRLADPFKSGMKLIGTKIGQGTACNGNGRSEQTAQSGGSWYPLQPKELPSGADKGKFLVPNPSTMPPVAARSSTWNPVKKDKEPVFVRPAPPPPQENKASLFKNSAFAIIAVLARFFVF